ncbi:MAG TPA: hypothetical protein DEO73_04215 [Pantoea sp.]|nr:hypothetical protein [Pantoea sp.]
MSFGNMKHKLWHFILKKPVTIFLQLAIFILICGLTVFLFCFIFQSPIKEFLSTFQWYFSGDSVATMNASEKKELAHLMSKNYILSTNDLVSQIGSFFSYTITILIFFCTISAFFAVLVIKINADDKIDSTINSKVTYFFANNKGFDANLRIKVSEAVTEEIERFSDTDTSEEVAQLRRDVDILKEKLDVLSNVPSSKDSEDDFDTKSYFDGMIESRKATSGTIAPENEEAGNGNT